MYVRHDSTVHDLERTAWCRFQAGVQRDYQQARKARTYDSSAGYVYPSASTREDGAAWLAAYRERDRHCRRHRGG